MPKRPDTSPTTSNLALMVDVFCSCVEQGILPAHGSPCHRLARRLVERHGEFKNSRERRTIPRRKLPDPPPLIRHLLGLDYCLRYSAERMRYYGGFSEEHQVKANKLEVCAARVRDWIRDEERRAAPAKPAKPAKPTKQ